MKIKDIRELSPLELSSNKRELSEEVFHLRVQQQSGQLENPSQLRTIRRKIARIDTVITSKKKAAATS